jgi:hypothetical protein
VSFAFVMSADPDGGPAQLTYFANPNAISPSADGPGDWLRVEDEGAVLGAPPYPHGGESLRIAVALLPAGRTLALAALRPGRAKGNDRDEIEAVVHEDDETRLVDDPRFSVTLDGGGAPRRVGLELWLTRGEGENEHQYARRAAGEVAGEPLEQELDGVHAVAHPIQWRSAGETGSGWFVVLEPA